MSGCVRFVILCNVKSELQNLVRLQVLDEQLRTQRRRLDSIPEELGEREAALAAREASVAQHHADRESCLTRAQQIEEECGVHEQRIDKLDAQTRELSDAGSAAIARHEADALRAKVSQAQDEAISLMEQAEEFAQHAEQAHVACEEHRAELAQFRKVVIEDQASLTERLTELETKRGALFEPIGTNTKLIYEKIAEARDGRAVVPLRGKSCGGCGSPLPPNEQLKVSAAKSLNQCRSCGRVLIPAELWAAVTS